MKKINFRKIGCALLIIVLLLGAAVVASGFYFRHLSLQAMREVADVKRGVVSNPSGADLTIVVFFDYADTLNYQIYQTMQEALQADGHVRVVVLPFSSSVDSYQLALYMDVLFSSYPERAKEFHNKLLALARAPSIPEFTDMLTVSGFDAKKIYAEAISPETKQHIRDNVSQFRAISFRHAPAFVIGRKGFMPTRTGDLPGVNAWMLMLDDARSETEKNTENKAEKK